MSNPYDDAFEALNYARTMYDLGYPCPEAGRSHDSRPCCVCGKTKQDDDLRARLAHEARDEPREAYSNFDSSTGIAKSGEL